MIRYFIVINLITFILYYIDKKRAIKNRFRISEDTLILFSLFGGVIGALMGMKIFHHKTKKIKFYIFNYLFLIVYVSLVIYYILYN